MSISSMIHVRIDDDIKIKATEALDSMGLSVSDAVRIFLKRVVMEQAFPFPLKVPNTKTLAAMKEARAIGEPRFRTGQELIDAIEKTGV